MKLLKIILFLFTCTCRFAAVPVNFGLDLSLDEETQQITLLPQASNMPAITGKYELVGDSIILGQEPLRVAMKLREGNLAASIFYFETETATCVCRPVLERASVGSQNRLKP